MGLLRHILTLISALLIALISAAAAPASPIPAFSGEVVGDSTVFGRVAAGVKDINEGVDRATAGPAATAQSTAIQTQKDLEGWEPPAGYTKYDDGTVVAHDGQIYTASRRSDGTIRTNTQGHPIFNTQSGGTRAQTTLTKPTTSGSTDVVATNNGAGLADDVKFLPPRHWLVLQEELNLVLLHMVAACQQSAKVTLGCVGQAEMLDVYRAKLRNNLQEENLETLIIFEKSFGRPPQTILFCVGSLIPQINSECRMFTRLVPQPVNKLVVV